MSQNTSESLDRIHYWRKGKASANFGDYLNQWLADHVFTGPNSEARPENYLVIGSVLSNRDFRELNVWRARTMVWGAGVRSCKSLKRRFVRKLDVRAVRGHVSREVLGLDAAMPVGDPALLLPRFHTPGLVDDADRVHRLIVPHFYQGDIPDRYFLLNDHTAQVVRPAITPTNGAVRHLIDLIAHADELITNSLHAAIVACAYGTPCVIRPFGYLDCPVKWEDFFSAFDVSVTFDADGEFRVPPIAQEQLNGVVDRLLACCPFDTVVPVAHGDSAR